MRCLRRRRDNNTSRADVKITFGGEEYTPEFQIIDTTEKQEGIRPLIKILADKKNPSIFKSHESKRR